MTISILILTKMKSKTFLDALDLFRCSDIVVFDSYSTDNTAAIATSAGARLIQRPSQDQSFPLAVTRLSPDLGNPSDFL